MLHVSWDGRQLDQTPCTVIARDGANSTLSSQNSRRDLPGKVHFIRYTLSSGEVGCNCFGTV